MYARWLAAVFILVNCLCGATLARQSPAWEQVWIPTKEKESFGRESDVRLDAALYLPQGTAGPFPLVIWNHGSTGGDASFAKVSARVPHIAIFFLSRGFAMLVPMRRGRGASGGYDGETDGGSCDFGRSMSGIERAMTDVDATLAYAKTRENLDTSRLVIGGISRGGLLSVVYAARRSELRIQAVVNFSGGWTGDRCASDANGTLLQSGGAKNVPMIFLYGEHDSTYPDESIRRYAAGFEKSGGMLEFHLIKNDLRDGHYLSSQPKLWLPLIIPFFEKLGYPQKF